MRRQEYGRIVNITSIWAHISRPGRAVYTATKFGLRGLTTGHAVELARHNVLVNAVAPEFTLTDMARENYSEQQFRPHPHLPGNTCCSRRRRRMSGSADP